MEFNQSEIKNCISNDVINSNSFLCNSTPLLVVNCPKPSVNLIQNQINQNVGYVTLQGESTEMNSEKVINGQFIIQNSQLQQNNQMLSDSKGYVQMTCLTPSQLQSLSYIMQNQNTQFIQTSNGILQLVPQINTLQNNSNNTSNSNQENSLQYSTNTLPSIGYNFENVQQISYNNQANPDFNNSRLSQLIPIQQLYEQNEENNLHVSSVIDLNLIENEKFKIKKKRKVGKVKSDFKNTIQPTSTNEIKKEPAQSSCNTDDPEDVQLKYDNKGRAFSFVCPECPKKFTLNSRLNAHMRCHTGMRPFSCNVCGFSFTQKSYLIRHAAVHKEERPFHCEKCQKNYKHYGSLANHRKLHKKEENGININLTTSENANRQIFNVHSTDKMYSNPSVDSTIGCNQTNASVKKEQLCETD